MLASLRTDPLFAQAIYDNIRRINKFVLPRQLRLIFRSTSVEFYKGAGELFWADPQVQKIVMAEAERGKSDREIYDELKRQKLTPPGKPPETPNKKSNSPVKKSYNYRSKLTSIPVINKLIFDLKILHALNLFIANPLWKYDGFVFPKKSSAVRQLSFGDTPISYFSILNVLKMLHMSHQTLEVLVQIYDKLHQTKKVFL